MKKEVKNNQDPGADIVLIVCYMSLFYILVLKLEIKNVICEKGELPCGFTRTLIKPHYKKGNKSRW